jgi:RPA family protein
VGILQSKNKPANRHIAYKRDIISIITSDYIKSQGFNPNFLESNNVDVFRINLIGVIVDKVASHNQYSLILDDGTGSISVRFFGENNKLKDITITDVVMVIGRPREFSSERYLLMESISKVDPLWAQVRKLELGSFNPPNISSSMQSKNNTITQKEESSELFQDSNRNKVLKAIKKLDNGDGTSIEDLPTDMVGNIESIVNTLLKQGDIFEVRPGKIKVLE